MNKLFTKFEAIFEATPQIQLIALASGLFGFLLAVGYCFSHNNGFIIAIIGLLTSNLMLTQNYHGHNSWQRLRFGLWFSLICTFMFTLGGILANSIWISSIIMFSLILILSILNDHQLISSFIFYLAYAFILGMGFTVTSPQNAVKHVLFFTLGSIFLVVMGFIRLWLRHNILAKQEKFAIARYKIIGPLSSPELIFNFILALAVTLSNMVAFYIHIPHGYWLPMTTLLVMRNDHVVTLKRSKARLIGSVIGITLAYLILRHLNPLQLCIATLLFFYTTTITNNRHYLAFCISITLLVLAVIFLDDRNPEILKVRVLATAIATIMVITASYGGKVWLNHYHKKHAHENNID